MMDAERQRLQDIVDEAGSCADDDCGCHQGAWDAKERLAEIDAIHREATIRTIVNADEIHRLTDSGLGRGLLDGETLVARITDTPPGWEDYRGLGPLEARFRDGDR